MVKTVYNLSCTDDLKKLINNMEYYHKQINDMLSKEVEININKVGVDETTDTNIDIQLACINACLATNEWITDCIANYRILIQKANMGIKPTVAKEENKGQEINNGNEPKSESESESESETKPKEEAIGI